MNQQLIFNNDFTFNPEQQAVMFSCLVSGLRVNCFIAVAEGLAPELALQQVLQQAFSWEDSAEQAIANDAYNSAGEIWL
ncbi:DUF1488 family protein [Rheinheimera salexigens]|uniref:DUF1488 domain-containing protein n=1 Tax=Rheinheimera salexigens TaxID=1628148 RepID=A0A1E7Q2D7_9GAMM|nr:DUF1488 family protein [Rheinheimera salexigens]OEY68286.1 DUF1488 domain-containing protein [Rheinheimera salexigens]